MDQQLPEGMVVLGQPHLFRVQQLHMRAAAAGEYLEVGLLGRVERVVAVLVRIQEPKQRQDLLILAAVVVVVVLKHHQMPVEATEVLALSLLKSLARLLQPSLVGLLKPQQHLAVLKFIR
jgi:hypothetical protein